MVRGQVVLEFLLTYGWAILIVVLSIFAVIYFGVFDSVSLETCFCPSKCDVSSRNISCCVSAEWTDKDTCTRVFEYVPLTSIRRVEVVDYG